MAAHIFSPHTRGGKNQNDDQNYLRKLQRRRRHEHYEKRRRQNTQLKGSSRELRRETFGLLRINWVRLRSSHYC